MTHDELEALFEYRDNDLYWRVRTNSRCNMNEPAGNLDPNGYRRARVNGKLYSAHHLVWWYHGNTIPNGYQIDHEDENKLNNSIGNLRLATSLQNSFNVGLTKCNNSGYKNVHWDAANSKWRVQVRHSGTKCSGGRHTKLEDAVAEATELRNKYHGEFANHG